MLPKPPKPEDPDELSPEEALIKQLEEYRQFKEVSVRMHQLEEEARALLTKLPEEFPLPPPNIEITGLTLEKLLKAYKKVLERARRADADDRMASREIRRDSFTVAGCMARISRRLRKGGCTFGELFEDDFTKQEVVTMFMALLELIKLNRLSVRQESAYEDIFLTAQTAAPA
jgi:segregation and condensation protein A